MNLDDLRALADEYFEWPDGNTQTVTLTSALLFAKHVLEISKKSLRTRNNAGMDALRDAAQQALEALDSDHPEIQLRAAIALRAALEQEQAEPVQEPVGWRIRAVGSMGWRGPWRAYWQFARPGVNEPEFCEFVALYTAPPPCPTAELRAVAAEREECAFVAEDWDNDSADPRDIAAAIRARGTS